MARRRAAAGMESLEDLARKVAILERELKIQSLALDKLKQLGVKHIPDRVAPKKKSA
jgi:hypothetical protein